MGHASRRHNEPRCAILLSRIALPSLHRRSCYEIQPCLEDCRRAIAPRSRRPGGHRGGRQSGVNTITKYDDSGTGSPFTNAFVNGPNGLALDFSGNLYVSTNANSIEKFASDGTDLGVFASTGLNFAMALAFDSSGNLYAANFGGNTIEKFAPDGTDLGVFAYVTRPTGLAFDAAGNLYVANFGATILRFAPNGTPLGAFATTGLNNPEGIAFDSSGNLYAANNGSEHDRDVLPEWSRSRRAPYDGTAWPGRPGLRHGWQSLRGQSAHRDRRENCP